MKKLTLTVFAAALVTVWTLNLTVERAAGVAYFKKEFEARYVKDSPGTAGEKALVESAAKNKCFICHAVGTDADGKTLTKKFHNAYGVHLAKLLDKDNFKLDRREAEPDKCKAEVQAALDKVEKMKVDPTDPNSPTWGDLLKQGKLSSTDVVEKK